MSMWEAVRFAVLGPVRGWQGDRELNLGGPRQRAMVAMLVLAENRVRTVDELVAGVWGAQAPARADHSLRTYASRLRAVFASAGLGRDCLVWAGGYRLRLGERTGVDSQDFARLTTAADLAPPREAAQLLDKALALFEGPVMAGIPGPFAERQQIAWADRHVSTLEEKLSLDLDCGRHAFAVAELSELAAAHPWRESLHATLMRAHYLSGRRFEALAVYQAMRERLADEVGVDPGPNLRQMHLRILRDDPSLSRGADTQPCDPPPLHAVA